MIYTQQIDIDQFEANDRNTCLIKKYGKIPSYALWTSESLEKTHIERLEWWNNFTTNNDKLKKIINVYKIKYTI